MNFLVKSPAQELTTRSVEDSTYYYYATGAYQSVIRLGRQARKEGFDYYYLNYRLAMAHYYSGDYKRALKYFEDAIRQNSADSGLYAYATHSAYLGGLDDVQHYLGAFTTARARAYSNYRKVKWVAGAYAEAGGKFSNDTALSGNLTYGHFGIQSRLGRRWNLYQAYSHIRQDFPWGQTLQDQYYARLCFQASLGWNLAAAYHYICVGTAIGSEASRYSESFAAVFSAQRSTGRFDLRPSLVYAQLNNRDQLQFNFTTVYSPLGNDKVNLGLNAMLLMDSTELRPSLEAFATLKAGSKMWLQGKYFMANTRNYTETDAFVINNSPDLSISRISAILIWRISDHVNVSFTLQRELKEESFSKQQYYLHNVFGGMQYKF